MSNGLYLDPTNQTVVVTITAQTTGASVPLFSDANTLVSLSNPFTLAANTPQTVYTIVPALALVSMKVAGIESATPAGTTAPVVFSDGGIGSIQLAVASPANVRTSLSGTVARVGAHSVDVGGTTAVGSLAGSVDTSGSATAIGANALKSNTTGGANVAVGQGSMGSNTTGSANAALGQNAMQNNTTGNNNTAVGQNALQSGANTGANTAVGFAALSGASTASNNVAVGYQAFNLLTTGGGNVGIGQQAGSAPNGVAANATTTGAGQTLIGLQSGQASPTAVSYITTVGYKATAGAAGAMAFGTDSTGLGATSSTQDQAVIGTSLTTLSVAKLSLSNSTVGAIAPAAGTAGALPALPTGYVTVTIAGVARQIAFY